MNNQQQDQQQATTSSNAFVNIIQPVNYSTNSARPGSMVRVPELLSNSSGSSSSSSSSTTAANGGYTSNGSGIVGGRHTGHSRNSSWDLRLSSFNGNSSTRNPQVYYIQNI